MKEIDREHVISDDLGRLGCVIQPEGVQALLPTNHMQTPFIFRELAFRYGYDERGRMVVKQLPGAEPVRMIYHNRDRLVYSQDGNQRKKNQWMVNFYDPLNRITMTGIMEYSGTPESLRDFAALINPDASASVNSGGRQASSDLSILQRVLGTSQYQATSSITFDGEFSSETAAEFIAEIATGTNVAPTTYTVTGNPIPTGAKFYALTQTFYNDYSRTAKTYDNTFTSELINSSGNTSYPENLPTTASTATRGLVTSSKVWVMDDASDLSRRANGWKQRPFTMRRDA